MTRGSKKKMYYAHVFHQDPTTKDYTVRRTGAPTNELQAAIRMIEKSKQEGYVVRLGNKIPVWQNVKPVAQI